MKMNDKEKLGVLGSGMAKKAGKAIVKNKKKKKSRLDEIMGGLKSGRKAK
ncbi:MAG: hypothetical protein KJO69_00645 [Gammaproteobacteria bacterium]|nr:hypothetical protein [Gammaproteobacteria bacterium]